jgi:hypothetical protein
VARSPVDVPPLATAGRGLLWPKLKATSEDGGTADHSGLWRLAALPAAPLLATKFWKKESRLRCFWGSQWETASNLDSSACRPSAGLLRVTTAGCCC